jgi:hypothetical protein
MGRVTMTAVDFDVWHDEAGTEADADACDLTPQVVQPNDAINTMNESQALACSGHALVRDCFAKTCEARPFQPIHVLAALTLRLTDVDLPRAKDGTAMTAWSGRGVCFGD